MINEMKTFRYRYAESVYWGKIANSYLELDTTSKLNSNLHLVCT